MPSEVPVDDLIEVSGYNFGNLVELLEVKVLQYLIWEGQLLKIENLGRSSTNLGNCKNM